MSKTAAILALASCALLGAGCARQKTPTVNNSMTHIMQPQAQTIWDISSRAFNGNGDGLDPTLIKPAEWVKLAKAGRQMRDRGLLLANEPHVQVVSVGETIMGETSSHGGERGEWDAASPHQVQAYIDANPKLFAERARVVAKAGQDLLDAAHRHDAKGVYAVSSNLDEVCDGCHEKFWGTDEPPPFKAAEKSGGKWIKAS